MSDKRTEVEAGESAGFAFYGHLDPAAAIAEARSYFKRQRDAFDAALDAVGAGDVRVYHQLNVWRVRDRRLVYPVESVSS